MDLQLRFGIVVGALEQSNGGPNGIGRRAGAGPCDGGRFDLFVPVGAYPPVAQIESVNDVEGGGLAAGIMQDLFPNNGAVI